MKFEEIKNNPEIMSQLRWDLTPQNSNFPNGTWTVNNQADIDAMNKFQTDKAGYYFYIDVANCQAHLAIMQNHATGSGTMHRIEDFESPLLEKAVEEIGSITTSGWYPLNKRLETLLKKKLGVQ
jgi:hypothetical protein